MTYLAAEMVAMTEALAPVSVIIEHLEVREYELVSPIRTQPASDIETTSLSLREANLIG